MVGRHGLALLALAACTHPAAPAEAPAPGNSGPPGAYGDEAPAELEAADSAGAEGKPPPAPAPAAGPAAPSPAPSQPAAQPVPEERGAPRGLTSFEAGVAATIDRLRRDPTGFAAALAQYRRYYVDTYIYLPGLDAPIQTAEGVRAVDEAIAAARRARPRPSLRISPGLSRAARAHAFEIGRAGSVDHNGRDGSEPLQRMERHGRVTGLSGENIGTGWGDSAVMVMSLFVDDGIRGRGHRVNLLELGYHVVGVGCGPHSRFGTVCVLDFADEFRE
ncbi:MAG TPA: CAP domain-containing protein [Kofleriaceae bacterium]|nr:CAP domain-containing protein [Kofleriaceae bacterium]